MLSGCLGVLLFISNIMHIMSCPLCLDMTPIPAGHPRPHTGTSGSVESALMTMLRWMTFFPPFDPSIWILSTGSIRLTLYGTWCLGSSARDDEVKLFIQTLSFSLLRGRFVSFLHLDTVTFSAFWTSGF